MRHARENPRELAQCPVCRTILGNRDKNEIYMAHCQECRATFYWKPWIDKPSVQMDKDIPEKCGCHACS